MGKRGCEASEGEAAAAEEEEEEEEARWREAKRVIDEGR